MPKIIFLHFLILEIAIKKTFNLDLRSFVHIFIYIMKTKNFNRDAVAASYHIPLGEWTGGQIWMASVSL